MGDHTVAYKYTGEVVQSKVKNDVINKVLDLFNPDGVERKLCYYPYWILFYNNGNVEILDALTGEKDEYLKNKSILNNLPI